MFTLIVFLHIVVCLLLILVILLQSGKAGDLASAFGGVGSQTAFGARGAATFLTKATTVAAVIFMITSLALSILSMGDSTGSVMDAVTAPIGEPAAPPEAPAPGVAEPEAATPQTETPPEE